MCFMASLWRRWSGCMPKAAATTWSNWIDPDQSGGTVRRPTPLGEVAVRFTHDRVREEMTVTIVSKPKLLPEADNAPPAGDAAREGRRPSLRVRCAAPVPSDGLRTPDPRAQDQVSLSPAIVNDAIA
jgi:hypothetical protein